MSNRYRLKSWLHYIAFEALGKLFNLLNNSSFACGVVKEIVFLGLSWKAELREGWFQMVTCEE